MFSIQIEQTRKNWETIVKQLESGQPVRLLWNRTVVATFWPNRKRPKLRKAAATSRRREHNAVGKAARKLATRILEPEDFSNWKS